MASLVTDHQNRENDSSMNTNSEQLKQATPNKFETEDEFYADKFGVSINKLRQEPSCAQAGCSYMCEALLRSARDCPTS